MKEIEELRQRMLTQRPSGWDALPDLALYMDQLISYMPRQLIDLEDGDSLTSAMVNNYIKDGLLPRAEGKRYGKAHLARLTAICAMKQVLSMREVAALLADSAAPTEEWYAGFLKRLDDSLENAAATLDPTATQEDLSELACRLALDSYASKLACQKVLDILREKSPEIREIKKKK